MEKEFRISIFNKCLYGSIAMAMLIFSMTILPPYTMTSNAFILAPVSLILSSVLICMNLARKSVTINRLQITCRTLFSKKELAITEIRGCRVDNKIIYIVPAFADRPTISIGNYIDLKDGNQIAEGCQSNFKDLNAEDLESERKQVLDNPVFGSDEQERASTLLKCKQFAGAYNILSLVSSIFAIFFASRWTITILLFYPFAGLILIITSKGLIKLFSNSKRSVCYQIIPGLLAVSLVVFLKSFDEYNILHSGLVWLPSLLATTIVFFSFYFTGVNRTKQSLKGQFILLFFLSSLYGFGSVRLINCLYDNSNPEVYAATVAEHRIARGKSTSYFLTLSPWGPVETQRETEVRRTLYYEATLGDQVKVNLKRGLLKIPWYFIQK